jgi:hypothetical protein
MFYGNNFVCYKKNVCGEIKLIIGTTIIYIVGEKVDHPHRKACVVLLGSFGGGWLKMS